MRGFYMDEPFTGSPSDLEHISHDTNFTAKQWVDNTSASLAPIEATSTASQPYTVGKRLVYGGRLYKVTQAIAQGGTLTPGTNITPDTVDEELNTISTHLSSKLDASKIETRSMVLTMTANGLVDTGISHNDYMVLSVEQYNDTNIYAQVYNNGNNWGVATKNVVSGATALAGTNVTFVFVLYKMN